MSFKEKRFYKVIMNQSNNFIQKMNKIQKHVKNKQ